MKICHITSVHSRYDTRIFVKECVSLAKAGYDVTFLIAEDIDHFPDALEEMIACGPEKRKDMGAKARAFAEEHYDWDNLALELSSTLSNIFNINRKHSEDFYE